eukprot:CAMPEP_0178460466 /NCGR_PEP_ID=MMETSP0689_2-20121128/48728_1 /TAXON_ID=160604 /ORGANISM="Amphidinium massartii, Strain CS-259" /LENGTH=409 /DNA_ID=CAMNT_0020087111 /DNA_START=120 /DNA_END=1350 /DNA_ORIENTATION=+
MAALLAGGETFLGVMRHLLAGWHTPGVRHLAFPAICCSASLAVVFSLCVVALRSVAVLSVRREKAPYTVAKSPEAKKTAVAQTQHTFAEACSDDGRKIVCQTTHLSNRLAPPPPLLESAVSAPGSFCDSGDAANSDSPSDKADSEPMRRAPSTSFVERRSRRRPPPRMLDISLTGSTGSLIKGLEESPVKVSADMNGLWGQEHLNLATPSVASSHRGHSCLLSPGTPNREDLKLVRGDVGAILFDFDGTLTATPGTIALRYRKQVELRERAPLLAPRLKALREAGFILGIISKSKRGQEGTITTALREAGLTDFFNGPIVAKAVGLEGKAGFINDLVQHGELRHVSAEAGNHMRRILLIDDDVYELERACERGIQTYSAPKEGGLQESDFDEIFRGLGMPSLDATMLVH